MATTPSAAPKTCTLRADAPVFVPREASESIGFKLNPAAAEYKPSESQQALDQLFSILTDASISEGSEHSDGSAESCGQYIEASGSATCLPGRTYAAFSSSGTLVGDTVDASTRPVIVSGSEGSSRETSPRRGVLHHHHPHLRHAGLGEVHVHHAEFVGSALHVEHARHAGPARGHAHAGHPQYTGHPQHAVPHVQRHGTTDHVPYRPYPAPGTFPAIPPGTPVPNYRPIPCEAYLVDHPLRDPRTGYWEVPAAQPIKHRYTEADLALFRSTHKGWKVANGIPLYAETNGNNNSQGSRCSQHASMAREYHAQNTYEYRDLESIQKVHGCAEGFWYGWY